MKERLISYFAKFTTLTEPEKEAIRESAHIENFRKGTVLLEAGKVSTEVYFILKGCVRQYYMIDGEEKSANFYTEEQWVISLNSHARKTPAAHYYDCVEDCALLVANEARYNPLYDAFPRFEVISRAILEHEFGGQQEIQASYVTDTAEQRYLKLLNHKADLVNRVPQYQLASYIGVKPETLSRIRRRLAGKK